MSKLLSTKLLYAPIFCIYGLAPIFHDVVGGGSKYELSDWMALLGIYVVGWFAVFPFLYFILKKELKSVRFVSVITARLFLVLIVQVISVSYFWKDSFAFYVSLPIVMNVSLLVMAIRRSDIYTGYDSVFSGVVSRPSYNSGTTFNNFAKTEFEEHDLNRSLGTSMSEINEFQIGKIDFDTARALEVNPSSGLPMIGGLSGIDMNSNSWGMGPNSSTNNN
ncbi:hypothetical protein [Pectobacterium brasiliense]|uniref:hypothetical protein n=1 Tax=Pectobacterium brasiliense TaxID=180957 RepID=UPI0019691055|nr:hypothetical protein [Pectobacterium brasiliense]MBN3262945.1 hypothetical protein [Pectobacterium brasiliense]